MRERLVEAWPMPSEHALGLLPSVVGRCGGKVSDNYFFWSRARENAC